MGPTQANPQHQAPQHNRLLALQGEANPQSQNGNRRWHTTWLAPRRGHLQPPNRRLLSFRHPRCCLLRPRANARRRHSTRHRFFQHADLWRSQKVSLLEVPRPVRRNAQQRHMARRVEPHHFDALFVLIGKARRGKSCFQRNRAPRRGSRHYLQRYD